METRNRNHILLRYALVIVGVLVFSVAIVKKAADTCIIHADKWNEKAARMLSVTHEVMPERGDILAQNGEVMATNMTYYRALIDFGVPKFKSREFNDSLKTLCKLLGKYFPERTPAAYEKAMRTAFLRKKRYFVLVREITGRDYELLKTFPFYGIDSVFGISYRPRAGENSQTREALRYDGFACHRRAGRDFSRKQRIGKSIGFFVIRYSG